MLALAALAACDHRVDSGPIVVDAIGGPPLLTDAARRPLDMPGRLLAASIAQGLVRFDASGQIEPGLAERWTVIDNGMSYIFRLRAARWPDGRPITAAEVAAALRHQLARTSRNPLAPFLSAVAEVVEMTPEVLEVRLSRPRPDLLKLFAQPELAVIEARPPGGGGPMRLIATHTDVLTLRPDIDPAVAAEDAAAPAPEDQVSLSARSAARAIARFVAHRTDLVAGGSFVDWPLLTISGVAPANVRIDPAAGLLGLAITSRDGFLADPLNRDALSSILDRPAIAALFGQWSAAEQIAPETLDSAAPPTIPAWAGTPLDLRRAAARVRVATWRAAGSSVAPSPPTGSPVTPVASLVIRVALPAGPGATLLWGQVAAALISVGVTPVRVGMNVPAELTLVDAVAPYDSARWYLATACRPCGTEATAKLDAAREAPTLALRAEALAAADQAIAADAPFIPIARPLRWSLVALRLRQWQPNARAWHPLNHLRGVPTSSS